MHTLYRKFKSKMKNVSFTFHRERDLKHILATILFVFIIYLGLQLNIDTQRGSSFFNLQKSKWPIYLAPTYGKHLETFNLSRLSKKDRIYVENYMPVMMKRLQIAGDYCQNHPELTIPGEMVNLAWVIRKNLPNICWCCNFKVGSGTWVANFLRVAHFNQNNTEILKLPKEEQDLARYQAKYGANFATIYDVFTHPNDEKEKVEYFSDAIRFLVVRHPFTRILSAFRNVIELSIPTLEEEPYYKKLRAHIVETYRPNSLKSRNKSEYPTFPEFVDYFINDTKQIKTAAEWNGRSAFYWEPYWAHCHVCASDYNVIVKLETMAQDERFIAILGRLKEVKERKKTEWRHVINEKTSFDLADKYFRLLSQDQILDLYNIFKHDFEIFNYDIEKYLRLAVM